MSTNERRAVNGKLVSVPVALTMAAFALLPAGAAVASSSPGATTTPAPGAGSPTPTPGAPVTPQPAPPAERVKLKMSGVGGKPLFAGVGAKLVIYGRITPYQVGQRATIAFYLRRRQIGSELLRVAPRTDGSGSFQVRLAIHAAGPLTAVAAVHVAPGVVASAHTPVVQYVHTGITPGTSGGSVRVLQSELNRMHYAVPLSGVFDEATERALIAFRKVTGMGREGLAGTELFRKLAHGEGAFPVRYRHDGRHVEANLTKQVLAEIEPGGKVRDIYTMSSGKPSTPTVVGRFSVYMKTLGVNAKGMVDSNYFIRGYAIHGYAEVPTYAASHGCLRVPIPNAPAIYSWVRLGTPVDVYDQGGGGSTHPRGNAGP